jgi:hypothetical protein
MNIHPERPIAKRPVEFVTDSNLAPLTLQSGEITIHRDAARMTVEISPLHQLLFRGTTRAAFGLLCSFLRC